MKKLLIIGMSLCFSFTASASTVATDVTAQSKANECGTIVLYEKPPRTKNIYHAVINTIDDQVVSPKAMRFALSPGKHTIKVIENIQDNSLTRRRGEMKNYKLITFEVKANEKYSLGAKFHRNKRSKLKTGEYWDPIVWKSSEKSCSL